MAFFFKTWFQAEENAEVTKRLLDMLNVQVTLTTLQKEITGHPDYPSLLSISDTLAAYGVENMSLQVEASDIEKLPVPFIAVIHDKEKGKDLFAVVKSVSPQTVMYYHPAYGGWRTISRDAFISQWPSRIALLADAEGAHNEKDYAQKVRNERQQRFTTLALCALVPLLTIASVIAAYISYGTSALPAVFFTLLMLAGCLISALLIWYELDEYNPLLQQICSTGKKINCSAILSSKASRIGGISWSTIGFTYFSGGLLLLLFSGIANFQTLFLLSGFALLASPYLLFSVYYQWRVAKQWCILCLMVQAVLALQLLTVMASHWLVTGEVSLTALFHTLIAAGLAYAVPFISLRLWLPAYRSSKKNKAAKDELQKLKHNTQIFDALLAKQKHIPEEPDGLGITLGNPNAAYKIIKVCNPYCGPCAAAHPAIEALLRNNPDIQVQILFTATSEANDQKAPPVKHLLAIAQAAGHDEEIIRQALDDWYLSDRKDYAVFAEKHPLAGDLTEQDRKLDAMRDWCNKAGIQFTPTFFINGYQLPEIYTISDLNYFLSA